MGELTLEELCAKYREEARVLELSLRDLKSDECFGWEERFPGQHNEMQANIMLAVRHAEDARMRIGKILQYAGDGISILDKK